MRVENKPIFPFFLSGCRIVEKKRYDKLNDAAYSALKYRVCAANFFINFSISGGRIHCRFRNWCSFSAIFHRLLPCAFPNVSEEDVESLPPAPPEVVVYRGLLVGETQDPRYPVPRHGPRGQREHVRLDCRYHLPVRLPDERHGVRCRDSRVAESVQPSVRVRVVPII